MSQAKLDQPPQLKTRILVLSDVSLYRDGLIGQLQEFNELSSEGLCTKALDTPSRLQNFDIALIDISIPKVEHTILFMQQTQQPLKIILLNLFDQPQQLLGCLQLGIDACISQSDNIECLYQCILSVSQEQSYFSSELTQSLIQQVVCAKQNPRRPSHIERLTNRQNKVLELMEKGQSNKAIARSLGIEVATVKNHVHSILDKLQVSSRCEAAALFRRHQLS